MPRNFGGYRKTKTWTVLPGMSNSFTVNATVLGGSLNSALPFTVMRMLGEYILTPDAAPSAQDACTMLVGIAVVSLDAQQAGSGSMPDPSSDVGYPWLYWAAHDFFFVDASLDSGRAASSIRRSFDIRSMRKVADRQALVMIAEYISTVGSPPMQIEASQTRILTALA